ncbi:sensor histidine kinase [Ruania halotolerans]|uniref:sensor histidine kinase n=1 Tax=Ruania halotolerans TaxID=2897773 RepID=UPI001E40A3F6|nr:HAMP domain-containing sensor histidine kinase [Ruania halotolerans]UFU08241.1 HAMP domain-containing histidine kinase [Ruania halotolerans]
MIPAGDLAVIIAVSLACALGAGLLGLLALHLTRSATMGVRIVVVAATGMLAVVAAMVAIAQGMYISEHDLTVLLYVATTAALSSFGLALVLSRLFAREAAELRRMARAIGAGERVEHAGHPRDHSEMARLADDLATTSRRLDEARAELASADASRRELFAWISHDLRTPLAGLRVMAEALEDGMAADPSRYHRQMRSQVDHLSSMVDDLFELSTLESGTFTLSPEEVSLYDLVSDAVADLRPIAEARDVRLRALGGPGPVILGDPRELTRVVENLLMNAIQHSPTGTEVCLETASDSHGNAVLSVLDAGGGIAEEDFSEIFRTGWRGTDSRTPPSVWGRSTGAGLGLAIVRGIVRAHRGEVSVANVGAGSRFEVRLPLAGSGESPAG